MKRCAKCRVEKPLTEYYRSGSGLAYYCKPCSNEIRRSKPRTKTQNSWDAMKNRCRNASHPAYARYGGRGIKVCDRWADSFENFLADMGERPQGMTLDRIDRNGDYCPENCRWATHVEQQRNRVNNTLITAGGRTQTQSAWAEELGVTEHMIHGRLSRGWSAEDALTKPPQLPPARDVQIDFLDDAVTVRVRTSATLRRSPSRMVGLPLVSLRDDEWMREEPAAPEIRTVEHEPELLEPPAPESICPKKTPDFGQITGLTFADAAAQYRKLYSHKVCAAQETVWLDELLEHIGALPLNRIYDDTLQPFIESQRTKVLRGGKVGVKSKTLALKLGLVRHILRKAAMSWRDANGETWLKQAPLITMPQGGDERAPRQLSWAEQREHLPYLPEHLRRMALFVLNTGVRDEPVCSLRWDWERKIEDPDVLTFLVPPESVKGRRGKKTARLLVCNSIARGLVEEMRGFDPTYVFAFQRRKSEPANRLTTMSNSAWSSWRRKQGLGDLHVHDLRHTAATRLREAGVAENTISDVLWHTRSAITAHYSVASIRELADAVERITEERYAVNPTLASLTQGR